MENPVIAILFQKYLEGSATPAETVRFYSLVREGRHEEELKELLDQGWLQYHTDKRLPDQQSEFLFRRILSQSAALQPPAKAPVIRLWKRLAVAAAILLICGSGIYFLLNKNTPRSEIVKADITAPATNRAMITLASGEKIYLDSVGNGQLALQGNTKLTKLSGGAIAYETANGTTANEMSFNTLYNPRGSQVIDITLSDGSKLWLNAGSRVRYPVSFAGKERKIEMDGEAYFEIKHDAAHPFIVSNGDMRVEVLGTHFNVNTYEDEENRKVTLLEGSVKVSSIKEQLVLKPGQQAIVDVRLAINNEVDMEQVMAWKNGRFVFNKTDIRSAMRQLVRWYDVDIEYRGDVKGFFSGSIDRQENISQVLKMLELTDEVHFEIDGRKIIVKP